MKGFSIPTLICLSLLASFAAAAGAQASAPKTLTYADILRQLTDLDRLTRLHPGFQAGQFSSWDRNGREVWGANGDAGHYLREEPNGEAVMMEIDGPGVIYRVWSANPQGRIRLYLDGDAQPTYEWDFDALFNGSTPPFLKPLVYKRGGQMSASDCYVPIPFRRSIKITADRRHGQYYHFNYLLYPKDWTLPSFRLPLTPEEQTELQRAAEIWNAPGRDPKPTLEGQTTLKQTITLQPGKTATLANLKGPGMVRAIRARASSEQRYFWRKLVLRGVWDGAKSPQILTPLGSFFGFDWETAEYGSLIAGCQNGTAYFHYPMPFRRSGRLELISYLSRPAQVEIEIDWAPVKSLPEDTLYLFARWRQELDFMPFEFTFLETAGKGHFVGVSMPIDHPLPGWWGEGDEKIWVDDDDFPPWIGTGSEDYFGDAWGIRYLSAPSFGCSLQKGNRTCNYRWHFMDFVPFSKRFRMSIENYGPNGVGPRGHYAYASTAFWYQAEATPPLEQLRGVTYTGGLDPAQKPSRYEYNPNVFGPLDANALRTYGLSIPYALEAEALFRGRIVTDADRAYEFSKERAVDFGTVKTGQKLSAGTLRIEEGLVYYPKIYLAPEAGAAEVTLEIGGRRLEILQREGKHILELSGAYLPAGEHPVSLIAASDGRAIVDCIQLQAAYRSGGAMEAEDLPVVRFSEGVEKPHASPPMKGASAGRILEVHATAPGQGVTLRFDRSPEKPYALGVRTMRGPMGGIIQAFAGGKPLGPAFDIYAPQKSAGEVIFPLGPMPTDTREVEIRVVGKNPQSQGYHFGLDYFRYEPQILGPESAEGVWAMVLGVRGGSYQIQDLGPNWSHGHHLWIAPSSKGAEAEIALEIPSAGDYEILVRYTTSWDYAIVQASLDGQAMGDPTDCYTPEVRLREPLTLGRVSLTAGRHILRFRAVGKNASSAGYLMGIDHITVRPAK